MEWLIKTFTNEGETVLDNCVGSGTTAIAALRTNRKCIVIDMDEKFIEITKNRVAQELEKKKQSNINF